MSTAFGKKQHLQIALVDSDVEYTGFATDGTIAALETAVQAGSGYLLFGKNTTTGLYLTGAVELTSNDGDQAPDGRMENLHTLVFRVTGLDGSGATVEGYRAGLLALDGTIKTLYVYDKEVGIATPVWECLKFTINVTQELTSLGKEIFTVTATENKHGDFSSFALAIS
jgi:hypothetical protein